MKPSEKMKRCGYVWVSSSVERQGVGDAVVNLAATTLAANAYLLTGEEKYKAWVREYVDAWIARTAENDGIVPDNVGLSGEIGEHIEGKWYGSYYGWSWPHGWHSVGQVVGIAAQNAALLWRGPCVSRLSALADRCFN